MSSTRALDKSLSDKFVNELFSCLHFLKPDGKLAYLEELLKIPDI